ncbi:MAG: DUF192 domain-containing protein [Candidatus Obscuribacter sp.]|nr:DUF192 domain-containing protein [Candidatus Obscuribacter sp.]MBK9281272.1 DUF192 domain-containing protein [Candidatus Obscuribacter sp.]
MKLPADGSTCQFTNLTKDRVLAERASIARSFFRRLKGLLGTDSLPDGEGLLLSPCNSIHMFGMKYAIDVIFLDKELVVVDVLENIAPGKASRVYRKAYCCLELPAGKVNLTGTTIGDKLDFRNP